MPIRPWISKGRDRRVAPTSEAVDGGVYRNDEGDDAVARGDDDGGASDSEGARMTWPWTWGCHG